MEGQFFPDQEQLLLFLRRLKEVFDVCDDDADGFIRVEHLEDLGLQFGQGDEVRGWPGGGWVTIDRLLLSKLILYLTSCGLSCRQGYLVTSGDLISSGKQTPVLGF